MKINILLPLVKLSGSIIIGKKFRYKFDDPISRVPRVSRLNGQKTPASNRIKKERRRSKYFLEEHYI